MFSRLRRLARIAGREITILWFACRNPATPLLVKLGAGLLAVYLISPIDLIPAGAGLAGRCHLAGLRHPGAAETDAGACAGRCPRRERTLPVEMGILAARMRA
jgi:hypothetical protein